MQVGSHAKNMQTRLLHGIVGHSAWIVLFDSEETRKPKNSQPACEFQCGAAFTVNARRLETLIFRDYFKMRGIISTIFRK